MVRKRGVMWRGPIPVGFPGSHDSTSRRALREPIVALLIVTGPLYLVTIPSPRGSMDDPGGAVPRGGSGYSHTPCPGLSEGLPLREWATCPGVPSNGTLRQAPGMWLPLQ